MCIFNQFYLTFFKGFERLRLQRFFISFLEKEFIVLGVFEDFLYIGLQYGYLDFQDDFDTFGRPQETIFGNRHTLIHFSLYHLRSPRDFDFFPVYFPPRFLYS
jgi:hypothetical protein